MADDPGDPFAEPSTPLRADAGTVTTARRTVAPTMVPLHRRPGLRHGLRAPGSPSPAADPEPAVATPAAEAGSPPGSPPPPPATDAQDAPAATPRPARGPRRPVADDELAWAATSTLVRGLRDRLAARRRPWTAVRVLRAATATTAVVVVLLLGVAWGATSWVQAAIREIGALDPDSTSIVDAAAQRGDQNYLVIGSDTRVGATPDESVGDESGIPGARSDTVMVIHIPADRSAVTAVSFPRDLEIDRPACQRWDPATGAYLPDYAPDQPKAKLNTAYQVGGPRCVTKVVQALSGLAVNHFLGIDFGGFKGMVDAVGGVPICLDRPLRDAVLGDVVDRAGPTVLTGDQALGFVRARHVVGDPTSDYGRIQRQQRFLSALLREVLSAGTLLDVGKLRGLSNAVAASTFGDNVGADQLLALGRSLGGIDTHDVVFTTVPTTGVANDRGNEVLRTADTAALFRAVIDHQPLPGTPAAPGVPAPAAVPPQQVTVRLVDGRTASTSLASDPSDGSGEGGVPSGAYAGGTSDGSSDGSSEGNQGDSSGSSSEGDSGDSSGFRRTPAATAAPAPSTVASSLRGRGFTVVTGGREPATGTGAATASATVIRFSPDEQAAAATLARAVPGATLLPSAGAGLLDLVIGDGFDGRVVDPTAAAPVTPTLTAADTACS